MRLDDGGCGDHRTIMSKLGATLLHSDDLNGLEELERTFWPEELQCFNETEELDFEFGD